MKIMTDPLSLHHNKSLNRGLHVFTSFISLSEDFIFLDAHIKRLLRGADFLFPKCNWLNKHSEINHFMENQRKASSYFRLMIFDDILTFTSREHTPPEHGLKLGIAESRRTPTLIPSFVKTGSYLNAELELRQAALNGVEDVLFFDFNSNLCEATTSNVFVVTSDNKILTPKSGSMVLDGVTRMKLMEFLKKNGYAISESEVNQKDLEKCNEIWLTNSVAGIRHAESFKGQLKKSSIYTKVCAEFGQFGEKYE